MAATTLTARCSSSVMKTPKQKLADHLEVNGWDLEKIRESDLEWWADEVWELNSRWSPEGVSSFITFLVHPQHMGERRKGQAVWGAGSSSKFPTSRFEAETNGTISLNEISKGDIESFLDKIADTRSIRS
jgi:hypothetical protein